MQARLATMKDIEQLVKMRWDFSLEYDKTISPDSHEDFKHACTQFLHEAIEGPAWKVWVAELQRRVVSHMFVQTIHKVPRPNEKFHAYGYLTNVYTLPHYRRQGIGTALYAAVDRWAKEAELEFLIVWPSDNSVEFYKRIGFSASEEAMERHSLNNTICPEGGKE